jgi:hypothetical protein
MGSQRVEPELGVGLSRGDGCKLVIRHCPATGQRCLSGGPELFALEGVDECVLQRCAGTAEGAKTVATGLSPASSSPSLDHSDRRSLGGASVRAQVADDGPGSTDE